MQASKRKMLTGSTSPSANFPVVKKVNRTRIQPQVSKNRVSQVFVGSGFKIYYSFGNASRSVRFSIQTLMDETKPVDTEIYRFEYGG